MVCQTASSGRNRAWVEGNRLRLDGPFRPGLRYRLRLDSPVLSVSQQVVAAGAEAVVDLPDLRPRVSLPYSRGTLSPRGHLELDVRAVNVAGLRLGLLAGPQWIRPHL